VEAEDPDLDDEAQRNATLLLGEAQLILAEKRTSLAVMRLGIAVLALPLTVLGFLIVTSKYYDVLHVMYFVIPLIVLLSSLTAFGAYLVIRSLLRMHRYDRLILKIKAKSSLIAEFFD